MERERKFSQKVCLIITTAIILCLLSVGKAYAAYDPDFEIGNIYYHILPKTNNVLVTNNNKPSYSGKVIIPSSVIYEGKTYNVTIIGLEAFNDCKELTEVILPSSIKEIGTHAFAGCISLRSIKLPEGVEKIDNGAFAVCKSLSKVVLPKTLKEIGSNAFASCESLQSITIPSGVTELDKTFHNCTSLKTVILPNSLRCEDWVNYICIETQILIGIRGLEESKNVPMKNVI